MSLEGARLGSKALGGANPRPREARSPGLNTSLTPADALKPCGSTPFAVIESRTEAATDEHRASRGIQAASAPK